MKAKIKELWLIVECPECFRPQVVSRHVSNNAIIHLLKARYIICDRCDKNYYFELDKNYSVELGESDLEVS